MANSNKRKGDRAEREALEVICGLAPDLVVPRPQRLLGAGRREDTGDLWVLPGVTVQVKHRADPANAIRLAAVGSAVQAVRAGCAFAVGLVPIPRARGGTVRWAACCVTWPGQPPAEVTPFHSVTRALQYVRCDDSTAPPRTHRLALVERAATGALLLAPLEAWLHAYRGAAKGRSPADDPVAIESIEALSPAHGDHRSADEGGNLMSPRVPPVSR